MVWILEHKQDYDAALRYCDKALEIDPDYVYALSYKGRILLYTEHYKDALEYYDKSTQSGSRKQNSHLSQGQGFGSS